MVDRATDNPDSRTAQRLADGADDGGAGDDGARCQQDPDAPSRLSSRLLSRGEMQLLPRRVSRWLNLPTFVEVYDVRVFRMKKNYLWQAGVAAIVMLGVLLLVDSVADAVLAAGLGSSAVIAFVHPHSKSAALRRLVGGHLHGLVIGVVASWLLFHSGWPASITMSNWAADVVAAIALGVVILVMSVTDTEHPPAAATGLGFTLESLDWTVIILFAAGVLLLAISKVLFRGALRDLN